MDTMLHLISYLALIYAGLALVMSAVVATLILLGRKDAVWPLLERVLPALGTLLLGTIIAAIILVVAKYLVS